MAGSEPTIVFAASGTGGHLFPALFIADALTAQRKDAAIHFIGTGRPLEAKIIDETPYTRHVVKGVRVKNAGLLGKLFFLIACPFLIIYCMFLFLKIKPKAIVGVGGYASVVPVLTGWLLRKPVWIHEAEDTPGLANKLLSRFASKISTVHEDVNFPQTEKCVFTGYPVRKGLSSLRNSKQFSVAPKHLLIMGGSLGAEAVDDAVLKNIDLVKDKKLEVYHQCSANRTDALTKAYADAGIEARVVRFIDDMQSAYTWADAAISRAGAGICAELSLVNIPSIFIPLPVGGEQLSNAKNLADKGKALLVVQDEKINESLGDALTSIFNPDFHFSMRQVAYRPPSLDSAELIARGVLELAGC